MSALWVVVPIEDWAVAELEADVACKCRRILISMVYRVAGRRWHRDHRAGEFPRYRLNSTLKSCAREMPHQWLAHV